MGMEICNCKCHPVMQVCRVCCVRTAKDESFDLMMKQNQTALDLTAELEQAKEILHDLLRGGYHEGPCDNEGFEMDDGCTLHLKAAQERSKGADQFLKTLEKKERPLDCLCGRPAFEHGGCRNYRPNKPCPSTYTHSSLGKLKCEKDEEHLHRTGDVEHKNAKQIWMSL